MCFSKNNFNNLKWLTIPPEMRFYLVLRVDWNPYLCFPKIYLFWYNYTI